MTAVSRTSVHEQWVECAKKLKPGTTLKIRLPSDYVAGPLVPITRQPEQVKLEALETLVANLKVELDNRTAVMNAQRALIEELRASASAELPDKRLREANATIADLTKSNEYYKAKLKELTELAAGPPAPAVPDIIAAVTSDWNKGWFRVNF